MTAAVTAQDSKVDLLNDVRHNPWSGSPDPVPLKRALPFWHGDSAHYVHRIRSGQWYQHDDHLAFTMWCGQTRFERRGGLRADVLDGWALCATCEGRAIGAGQVTAETLVGHELVFSPHPAGASPCVWEIGRRGYAWMDYRPCGKRARFIATLDGEHRPTCGYHADRKCVDGWTLEPVEVFP